MDIIIKQLHLNVYMADEKAFDKLNDKLDHLLNHQHQIMATIAELSAKADLLQTTIDETQATALEKITTLETTVQELRDIIAAGGDPAALQEVADKLDSATADLKSTFPAPQP